MCLVIDKIENDSSLIVLKDSDSRTISLYSHKSRVSCDRLTCVVCRGGVIISTGCGSHSCRCDVCDDLITLFLVFTLTLFQCDGQCGRCGGSDVSGHLFGDILEEL